MSVRYTIIDSHRNMSSKRREDLCDFFEEVKGIGKEDAEQQVVFCDWYESEYAVKWFEVLATVNGHIAGYIRSFRNPDDVRQWYIGDVHVRKGYRRLGIATGMYEKAFKEYERYEAAENVVAAVRRDNMNSIGLHKKTGFEDTGELLEFADFFADENETKYIKWLYRYFPVPEKAKTDKLMEMFLPIWTGSAGKGTPGGLKAILKKVKSKESDAETIWCGNRLVGFTYTAEGEVVEVRTSGYADQDN